MKIGAITIGQAPRVDVTCDIMDIFGGKIELLQRGGLEAAVMAAADAVMEKDQKL